MTNFSDLIGLTLTKINVGVDEIMFHTENKTFMMYHSQDCCESVTVEDVTGDIEDLIGKPILVASEETSNNEVRDGTWTFYKLATINGYVDIRWFGISNGYYSESVNFKEISV